MPSAVVELLKGHNAPVRLVRPGPQGLTVTGDTEMGLCLWQGRELVDRRDLRSIDPRRRPIDRIRSAAFSHDGRHLYLACGSRLVATKTATGEELWDYKAPEFIPFQLSSPMDVVVEPSGTLVVPFDNGTFERISPEGKRLLRKRDNDSPNWIASMGTDAMIGCDGYHVCRWRLQDGVKIAKSRPFDHAFDFAYSDSSGAAIVRDASEVVLFEPDGPSLPYRIGVRPGAPHVAASPDTPRLAFVDGNEAVVVSTRDEATARVAADEPPLVSLAFGSRGDFYTGHADGGVRVWEV
ncbi:MAG: hypothetical protein JST30_10850 [Armatimonadetes bacterium]|nr:hypothetical protein [Armatimonadota bacterium]